MKQLTTETFKEEVFDFEKEDWTYGGQNPCIIDFSADWCGPCRALGPIFEDLENQYKDQINFFKVDIDEEPSLAQQFEITSIPTLIFLPTDGSFPQIIKGLLPKDGILEIIKDVFKLEE